MGTRLATTPKWYVYQYICEELISMAGYSLRGAIYTSRKKAPMVRREYTGGEWKDIIRLVKEKSQNSSLFSAAKTDHFADHSHKQSLDVRPPFSSISDLI